VSVDSLWRCVLMPDHKLHACGSPSSGPARVEMLSACGVLWTAAACSLEATEDGPLTGRRCNVLRDGQNAVGSVEKSAGLSLWTAVESARETGFNRWLRLSTTEARRDGDVAVSSARVRRRRCRRVVVSSGRGAFSRPVAPCLRGSRHASARSGSRGAPAATTARPLTWQSRSARPAGAGGR